MCVYVCVCMYVCLGPYLRVGTAQSWKQRQRVRHRTAGPPAQ